MGQTVNLLSLTSVVRIHLPPPNHHDIVRDGFFIACMKSGGGLLIGSLFVLEVDRMKRNL